MGTYLGLPTELWAAAGRRGSHPNTIPRYAVTPRGERSMVIVPQEVSKPWPMAFGTLAGDILDDAKTPVSGREKVHGPTVFVRSPSPPSPRLWVPTCQIYTTLLVTTTYLLLTVYCLLFITATPLRRLRYAVTRAPRSRSLRGSPGRQVGHRAREHGAKQISHYTSMRAPTG